MTTTHPSISLFAMHANAVRVVRSALALFVFAFTMLLFFAAAPNANACGATCEGGYYPAGTSEAYGITGRYDTAVCMGTVTMNECPEGDNSGGGGGGGGGGGFVNSDPTGSLDSATCSAGGVSGWAHDVNTADPIDVHLYINGSFVGAVNANQYRGDLVTAGIGDGSHAFTWSLPEAYKNGNTYTLTAYAINRPSGNNPAIGSRSFQCSTPPTAGQSSASITANPGSITIGSATQLSWDSDNVTSCSINQGIGTVSPNTAGALNVSPTETTTYVISCSTGTASGSTWQYSGSDTSDLSCPLTQNSNVYSGVPNCPANPQGQACTGSGSCKINYANQSTCNIETTLYQCQSSGSSTTGTVSSAVTVTVSQLPNLLGYVGSAVTTGVNQAVTLYGSVGNLGGAVAPASTAMIEVCDANCATVHEYGAASVGSLESGASQTVSVTYAPLTTVQHYYRVCADWTGSVTESNEGDNCSGWQLLNVSTTVAPDLSVTQPVTPTTANVDEPVTFTGSVTNVGNDTSGSFPMLFQVEQNGDLFESGYLPGLASGASAAGSAAYTFTASGTYRVRACANYNRSWIAITPESNYTNNCGLWTTITVDGDTPTGSSMGNLDYATCDAAGGWAYDQDVPNQAIEVHLYIDGMLAGATTASEYRADLSAYGNAQHGFTWSIPEQFKDSTSHTLRAYAIDANGGTNSELNSSPRSFQCEPTITWCTAGTATLEITAVPNRVRARNAVDLRWSASGVRGEGTLCRVTGPGVSWSQPVSLAPSCSASGSARPTIYTQSTYTLTCGPDSKSVTVNVVPNFQEF